MEPASLGPGPRRRREACLEVASRRQHGFSFIEILIVMGIISVLVGGVIVGIGMWTKAGPEFATKNTLTKLKAAIEDWERRYEMLPPSKITRIGDITGVGATQVALANPANEPIEAVFQALAWPGFTGEPEWDEGETGNLDEDSLEQAINKHGTTALLEILDGWGNPLVYFPNDDYGKAAESGPEYLAQDRDENLFPVHPQPWRNDDGTFVNPSSFQLYSMGPDGEPNTDDDVRPWER
jgi:prepilin-type N-terminal cleavage/methylation domain-containing protein